MVRDRNSGIRVVEPVVHVVAPDVLPRPRRLVVELRYALLKRPVFLPLRFHRMRRRNHRKRQPPPARRTTRAMEYVRLRAACAEELASGKD